MSRIKECPVDDALFVLLDKARGPESERGSVITEAEIEELYDFYEDYYKAGTFEKFKGRNPDYFSREVRAIMELFALPRSQTLAQRIFGKLLAPFPNGYDSDVVSQDLLDRLAERVDEWHKDGEITDQEYQSYRQTIDQIHQELFYRFHAHDLGALSEGECYYKHGEDCQPSAVGAPHEGFDLFTSRIARSFAEMHRDTAVVYCEGFRKGQRYDVNRPSGKDGETRTARQVMEKYERHIQHAYGGIPRLFHEIHGKGVSK